ncbi:MAG: glycoside hydrolase family 95 protein [Treponema sp.]|nr:glycoside hydrolase family 95 protein [Treponema sp.]
MNTLSYDIPAQDVDSSFIVGNGRIGACIYGSVEHNYIKIMEESVWNSVGKDRNNASCADNLKHIHELISKSDKKDSILQKEASDLITDSMSGVPLHCSALRQYACSLSIDYYSADEYRCFENVSAYKRTLDFETAIASLSFSSESSVPSTAIFSRNTDGSSVMYSREAMASAPADVIAFHVSASIPKQINFRVRFDSNDVESGTVFRQFSLGDDVIAIENVNGIPFCAMAMVSCSGGKVYIRGGSLIVEGADDATLYIDVETAFRNRHYARKCGNVLSAPSRIADWCSDKALKKLCFALYQPYQEFRTEHIMDFSRLYNKTSLSFADGSDTEWNYARYIILSFCKSPGTLPALQKGSYLLKKGMTSLYAPICMNGMKKMFLPLISLLCRACRKGRKTAAVMYNCNGYVIHNALDIWGDSVSSGTDNSDFTWIMGAAVLAPYVREYYEYTLDKKFLKKYFYLLKEACDFYIDFLKLYPNSPFLNKSIIANLFSATLRSVKDLCLDDTKSDIVLLKNIFSLLSDSSDMEENDPIYECKDKILCKALMLSEKTRKIVFSELIDDTVGSCVVINLLPEISQLKVDGFIKGVCLKGNLTMDIEWKDDCMISAKVYADSALEVVRNICICYKGKEYKAEVEGKSLDIKNVLPSTM